MINEEQYLLGVLAEECNEIAVMTSKAVRFGLEDSYPESEETNKQAIIRELNDLFGVLKLMGARGILPKVIENPSLIYTKQLKVLEYMDYSVTKGILQPKIP